MASRNAVLAVFAIAACLMAAGIYFSVHAVITAAHAPNAIDRLSDPTGQKKLGNLLLLAASVVFLVAGVAGQQRARAVAALAISSAVYESFCLPYLLAFPDNAEPGIHTAFATSLFDNPLAP